MYILHLKLGQPSGYRLRLKPAWEMAEQRCGRNLGSGMICHGFSESARSGILPSGLSASLLLKPVSVSLWQNNFLSGKYCWLPLQYFLSFSSLPWEPHFFFFLFSPSAEWVIYSAENVFSSDFFSARDDSNSSYWDTDEKFWVGPWENLFNRNRFFPPSKLFIIFRMIGNMCWIME